MSKKENNESARELLERAQDALAKAEENFAKSFNKAVKEFAERAAELQGEAKRRFEEALEMVGANSKELTARLPQDALAKMRDFGHELETKVEQGTEAFWSALGLASKAEVHDLQRKITQLQKRVKELEGNKKPAPRRAEA